MLQVQEYVKPATLEQAYQWLLMNKGNRILGGGAYLRLGNRKVNALIDLSALGLDAIEEREGEVILGACTTLHQLETAPCLHRLFNGVIPKAVSGIVGIQLRNIIQTGGAVYAKQGFSDLITVLLCLDVTLYFVGAGRVPLEEYMKWKQPCRDVLYQIAIQKNHAAAAYQCFRQTGGSYPLLNAALSRTGECCYRLVFGARPAVAKLVVRDFSQQDVDDGRRLESALNEIPFGSDIRASGTYRSVLASVLGRRLLKEIRREG